MEIDEQITTEHLLLQERTCRSCGQDKSLLADFHRCGKDATLPSSYAYEYVPVGNPNSDAVNMGFNFFCVRALVPFIAFISESFKPGLAGVTFCIGGCLVLGGI